MTTVGDLKRFRAGMDLNQPVQHAFSRYLDSWKLLHCPDDEAPFEPCSHVSEDLSAALYHGCPCVFMGTNAWALASYADPASQKHYLSFLAGRIGSIRKKNPEALMVVSVVPEKDYTISRMFEQGTDKVDGLAESMLAFRQILTANEIHLVFDEYLEGLSAYQSISDYEFPDSHLPSANYLQILSRLLAYAGVPWNAVQERLSIHEQSEYLDLVDKLQSGTSNPVEFPLPQMSGSSVELIGGSETFEQPLGDTTQVLLNRAPIDERGILILGDSHSSIYSRKKLTYLLAHVFSETTFNWNPCGFREEVGAVPHPIIILEVTQRFLYKP